MTSPPKHESASLLERFARALTQWTGSTSAFTMAFAIIVVWGATGWLFDYSDTWQLVINTGTTTVTFLMVFLIQRSQNKDSLAIHLKLNELVASIKGASNRIVNVEDLTEAELRVLHAHYVRLAELAQRDVSILESHSVDEAEERAEEKREDEARHAATHHADRRTRRQSRRQAAAMPR
jgi:low affinity Fe/Cu permease